MFLFTDKGCSEIRTPPGECIFVCKKLCKDRSVPVLPDLTFIGMIDD